MTEGTKVILVTEDYAVQPSTATSTRNALMYSSDKGRGPAVERQGNLALLIREDLAQGSVGRIIDNFERGDLSPYSGLTGIASVQSDVVQTGDYALEIDPDEDGSTGIFSFPGDGLPNYPSEGDITEYFVRQSGYYSAGFHVGMGSDLSGYRVAFTNVSEDLEQFQLAIYETTRRDNTDGKWNINQLVNGEDLQLPDDTWYKVQTELHPDKIVNRAFRQDGGSGPYDQKLDEIEASIDGYNGRGMGFSQFNLEGPAYFDNARIVGSV
jgi:hypothetical protein